MKIMLTGFLGGVVLLTSTIINAVEFGAADDTYIGFQVKIPFAAKRLSLFANDNEYSAILVNQTDGFKNGLVFTRYANGTQAMEYALSDITLPIVILDSKGVNQLNMNDGTSGASILGAVVGVVALIAIAKKAAEEVTESVVETALEVIENNNN